MAGLNVNLNGYSHSPKSYLVLPGGGTDTVAYLPKVEDGELYIDCYYSSSYTGELSLKRRLHPQIPFRVPWASNDAIPHLNEVPLLFNPGGAGINSTTANTINDKEFNVTSQQRLNVVHNSWVIHKLGSSLGYEGINEIRYPCSLIPNIKFNVVQYSISGTNSGGIDIIYLGVIIRVDIDGRVETVTHSGNSYSDLGFSYSLPVILKFSVDRNATAVADFINLTDDRNVVISPLSFFYPLQTSDFDDYYESNITNINGYSQFNTVFNSNSSYDDASTNLWNFRLIPSRTSSYFGCYIPVNYGCLIDVAVDVNNIANVSWVVYSTLPIATMLKRGVVCGLTNMSETQLITESIHYEKIDSADQDIQSSTIVSPYIENVQILSTDNRFIISYSYDPSNNPNTYLHIKDLDFINTGTHTFGGCRGISVAKGTGNDIWFSLLYQATDKIKPYIYYSVSDINLDTTDATQLVYIFNDSLSNSNGDALTFTFKNYGKSLPSEVDDYYGTSSIQISDTDSANMSLSALSRNSALKYGTQIAGGYLFFDAQIEYISDSEIMIREYSKDSANNTHLRSYYLNLVDTNPNYDQCYLDDGANIIVSNGNKFLLRFLDSAYGSMSVAAGQIYLGLGPQPNAITGFETINLDITVGSLSVEWFRNPTLSEVVAEELDTTQSTTIPIYFKLADCSGLFSLSTLSATSWSEDREIISLSEGDGGVPINTYLLGDNVSYKYGGEKDAFERGGWSTGKNYWLHLSPNGRAEAVLTFGGVNVLTDANKVIDPIAMGYSDDGLFDLYFKLYLPKLTEGDDGTTVESPTFSISNAVLYLTLKGKNGSNIATFGTTGKTITLTPPSPDGTITEYGSTRTITGPAFTFGRESDITQIDYTTITNIQLKHYKQSTGVLTDVITGVDLLTPSPVSYMTGVSTSSLSRGDYVKASCQYSLGSVRASDPERYFSSTINFCKGHKYSIDNVDILFQDHHANYNSVLTDMKNGNPYIYTDAEMPDISVASLSVRFIFDVNHETWSQADNEYQRTAAINNLAKTPIAQEAHDIYPNLSYVTVFAVKLSSLTSFYNNISYGLEAEPSDQKDIHESYPNINYTWADILYSYRNVDGIYSTEAIAPDTVNLTTYVMLLEINKNDAWQFFLVVEDEFGQRSAFCLTNPNQNYKIPNDTGRSVG